ncbi:MAG: FadR family transcriptional regulator [Anaerolineae bacterium]|nr:FadR family transcriptional regulator [Anaerolineae bacterium]
MLEPVARDTLTRQVIETIKRFILQEDLKPGAQLPSERELSEALTVSRNIVREALSALVAQGIVVKLAGKGNFVGEYDQKQLMTSLPLTLGERSQSLLAFQEARAALEVGAVGLIVDRVTDEEIDYLQALIDIQHQKHRDGKSTIKEDIDFHLKLLAITHNKVIEDMSPLVIEVFRRTLIEAPSSLRINPERIINEHQRIVDALRVRDHEAALKEIVIHLRVPSFRA